MAQLQIQLRYTDASYSTPLRVFVLYTVIRLYTCTRSCKVCAHTQVYDTTLKISAAISKMRPHREVANCDEGRC